MIECFARANVAGAELTSETPEAMPVRYERRWHRVCSAGSEGTGVMVVA